MKKVLQKLGAILMMIFILGAFVTLTACEKETPGEKIEEGLEEAGEGVEEGIEDLGDEIEENAEDAADNMEDAADNLNDGGGQPQS